MKPNPDKKIYIAKIEEAANRAKASLSFMEKFNKDADQYYFDSSVLQLRKALEAMVYSSIAPNKKEYEYFRRNAEKPADFTKDYNAKKIIQMLGKVNPRFFPYPVEFQGKLPDGSHHVVESHRNCLTKKRFIAIYDRLGKHLHADNPWAKNSGFENLAKDVPTAIADLLSLISFHLVGLNTKRFEGVWLVEVKHDLPNVSVQVVQAIAES